jgi:hypothetical protein
MLSLTFSIHSAIASETVSRGSTSRKHPGHSLCGIIPSIRNRINIGRFQLHLDSKTQPNSAERSIRCTSNTAPDRFTQGQPPEPHIEGNVLTFAYSPRHTTMSGCTLRFTRNSPLRTTLVDEATGNAKYQIDTPRRLVRSVTRIRKFDSSTQPPVRWDDADSDAGDDVIDKGKEGESKPKEDQEEEHENAGELPATSDEIARIYWKWFSSDRIVFLGRITSRSDFLPKCGKMKG